MAQKNSITKQGVMSDKKMLGDIWGTLKTSSCSQGNQLGLNNNIFLFVISNVLTCDAQPVTYKYANLSIAKLRLL